jgi:hypothetical protein
MPSSSLGLPTSVLHQTIRPSVMTSQIGDSASPYREASEAGPRQDLFREREEESMEKSESEESASFS